MTPVDHVPLAAAFLHDGVEGYAAKCLCGWTGREFVGRTEARTSARMAAERHAERHEQISEPSLPFGFGCGRPSADHGNGAEGRSQASTTRTGGLT